MTPGTVVLRAVLLKHLAASQAPLSTDDLAAAGWQLRKQKPEVYRQLRALEQAGQVIRLNLRSQLLRTYWRLPHDRTTCVLCAAVDVAA